MILLPVDEMVYVSKANMLKFNKCQFDVNYFFQIFLLGYNQIDKR